MKKGINPAGALAFLAAVAVSAASAADAPAKPWKDSAELSIVTTNGNSKNTTTSAKNLFNYSWTKTSLDVEAGGLGAKSQGRVTAEQYFAAEKLSYKVTDRDYVFERVRWDKDRFAGIKNRYDINGGAGRTLLKRPADELFAEVGPGVVFEQRTNGTKNNFGSARAYTKYVHQFSPTAKFSQDFEYLLNLKDTADSRHSAETALTAALNSLFSVKVSYLWKRVNKPAAGFSKDDTITSVALIASF